MADIAFLLLVFFLLATAIQRDDMGLPVTLPTLGTGTASVPTLLSVIVNPVGDVLVNGETVRMDALRAEVAAFADGAAEPHVALQTAARTPYADYVSALDAVLLGYRDVDAKPRLTLRAPAQ